MYEFGGNCNDRSGLLVHLRKNDGKSCLRKWMALHKHISSACKRLSIQSSPLVKQSREDK